MKKHALLIAFHFPPQAESSGIQRSLSFTRLLGRHDWQPTVLSAHARVYDVTNDGQLAAIPADIVVRRAFALDAKRHFGIRGRYLSLFALPDRYSTWLLGAIPSGLLLILRFRPKVLWSTFPVASAHLIGLALQRLTGLPWVADFRDPMLQPTYPTPPAQRAMFRWIERQTIARCRFAVFTTESARRSCRDRYPQADPDKFLVIENGYDEEEFGKLLQSAGASDTGAGTAADGRLRLLHSGVLYESGRDPDAFMRALALLKQQGKIDAGRLQVILRAPGDMAGVQAKALRHGVDDIVAVLPPIPYLDALKEMLASDGLLVFQGTPFNSQVPAKLYEYFRARKPILGLVDEQGETARVLRNAGFGALANLTDGEQISATLEQFLATLRDGSAHVASEQVIATVSRAHRAAQLAGVFDLAMSPCLNPGPAPGLTL